MTRQRCAKYHPGIPVIATGAGTAVGCSAPTTAASVTAAITRMAYHPFLVDSRAKSVLTARAQYLPDLMDGFERIWHLGVSAAREALGVIRFPIPEIPVIIGLGAPRPGFSEKMVRRIQERFEKLAHPFCRLTPVETICGGHSAGLMAVEKGCDIISKNQAPLCLAGGMDSWINPRDLQWLEQQQVLHSDINPWGLIPGEGAGFCLLAREQIIQSLKIPAIAHILAGAATREACLINTDTVCTGRGLSRAITLVAESCDGAQDKIDQIICDLNGQRYRADEFGFAIVKNTGYFNTPDDFLAPAACWGDVGAASGPLFISLAAHNALQGHQKGALHLILTGSDTGERSATLIRTPNPQGAMEE